MDQTVAKRELQALIKREDLGNKICVDCSNPNPQWASLSFAVFLCLQCAGLHRGFGVHVSFVRSVSMDTWQEEQVRRMKLGGNKPFREFMRSYRPAEQGGYTEEMNSYDTYHCWAASQYKEKLSANLENKSWSQSPPPADFASPKSGTDTSRPSSAQGLRKSRTASRNATGSSLRQNSNSPASIPSSPQPGGSLNASVSGALTPDIQKAANESFFANMGVVNASRPDNLPPSQGGRYQGFGSTPSPALSSQHPSYGLSSASAPSLTDFQENPTAALSKGWSLLSAAVVGASRVVSETVIQPGLERVRDPNFQSSIKGYVDEAGKRVGAVGSTANQWSKQQFGVDVAESVGGIVDTVKERVTGPGHVGYGSLANQHEGDDWGHYHDGEDEFFGEFTDEKTPAASSTSRIGLPSSSTNNSAPAGSSSTSKKNDDWDEWKDF